MGGDVLMSALARHTVKTNPQKPTCPVHQLTMRFDKVNSEWVCQQFDCTIVAKLKADVANLGKVVQPPTPDDPVVIDTPIVVSQDLSLEIRKDADGIDGYFIVAGAISIDVSDHVEMVVDENSDSVSLVLLFTNTKRKT
jgi:hypothetical protein